STSSAGRSRARRSSGPSRGTGCSTSPGTPATTSSFTSRRDMDTRTKSAGRPRTREPQYQFEGDMALRGGFARFGIMSNQRWRESARGLLFVLARYKFVAKMLSGKGRVVEVGCADAFGTRLVQQEVTSVTASDFDPVFVEDARRRMLAEGWRCDTA